MQTKAPESETSRPTVDGRLYATMWRWHFYAGLFVLPFIFILSITGSIYLFKPQVERWEERAYLHLGMQGAVSADQQLAAVRAAYPNDSFIHYRLPRQPGDAAMVQLGLNNGKKRDVFVSPQGKVLGTIDPDARIEEVVSKIHGSFLLGTWGDRLVELAASWTIVLILSGLYLWWPRPFQAAGTFYPRLSLRGRWLLKDIHRVAGFWISGLVLIMLASGLPWAGAWGGAFKWVRTELHLVQGPQDWKIGADGGHNHSAMTASQAIPMDMPMDMNMPMAMPVASKQPLSVFVAKAEAEHMAFPVLVLPPRAPQRFGPPTGDVWTAKSEAQNRPLDRQVTYDPTTGAEVDRDGWNDKHIIDRVVNTGIAWHEGQLFGWINQLIGVLTAITLMTISILGVLMWLKRRPAGELGAPPVIGGQKFGWTVFAIIALALLLPLFGLSLIAIIVLDRASVVLKRRSLPR